MKRLSQLRLVFIIYFLVKITIDIAAGGRISSGLTSYLTPDTFYTLAIVGNVILFLISLLLFYFLLDKKCWARIVLIIIGWLAVVDFFSSMMSSTAGIELLNRIDPSTNWEAIVQIDRVTDFVGFLFWGYTIFILQFNTDVKKLFSPECKESKPKEDKIE
ncbi:MAG: hypothetical protein HZB59_02240 [Ignavibacteriales bacterium]|nr:hypothetical protein [Ignavibacteriales bacterium]